MPSGGHLQGDEFEKFDSHMQQLANARDFLGSVGWLAHRPSAFRKLLLSRCRLHVLEKGAIVYRIGDAPDGVYGVASGRVSVEIAPHEQDPHLIHSLGPGSWFGEAAFFGECERLVTIVATRPSHCLHLPRFEIDEIAKADPNTWRWLGNLLFVQFQAALTAIDDLKIRRPDQRIAAILLRLAGIRHQQNVEDMTPEVDATQKDLAEISSLSRTTVGECLDQLQAAGLIARGYGHLTLLDPAALRRLIDGSR